LVATWQQGQKADLQLTFRDRNKALFQTWCKALQGEGTVIGATPFVSGEL
jgi:hypothetical protein